MEHAQELDPADPSIAGKLALARGYVNLNLAIGAQISVRQHMEDRVIRSWQDFSQSASLLPNAPDPYLGLARLYVYSFQNLDKAIEEWDKAEQHHYKLGPREIEQEADGFLLRARKELSEQHDRSSAKEDLGRAKELYQSIATYNDVSERLRTVAQDQRELNPPGPPAPAQSAVAKASPPNPHTRKGEHQLGSHQKLGRSGRANHFGHARQARAGCEAGHLPGAIWLLLASLFVAGSGLSDGLFG